MLRSLRKSVVSQATKHQHPSYKINSTVPSPQTARITSQSNNPSSSPEAEDNSLTISYLQSSCGLPSQSSLSASKLIRLKSTEKADRVLQLFKDYGFSDTQISTVISKYPRLLLAEPKRTLKPKLEYLRRTTGSQLVDILSANPLLMIVGLERTIVPSVDYFKSIDPSCSLLLSVLKSPRRVNFPYLRQNIKTLRDSGATEAVIVKLLKLQPASIYQIPTKFCNAVEMVKGAGLDPKSTMLARALRVISNFSKSAMDRKMKFYHHLGWSDRDIMFVICRQPTALDISDKLILEKVRFFKEIAGWDMSFLLKHPVIFNLSLNKRVAPRFAVLDILMQRGFIKRNRWPITYLYISETQFRDNFVDKYKEQAPEVAKAIRGELEFKGWGWIDKQAVEVL